MRQLRCFVSFHSFIPIWKTYRSRWTKRMVLESLNRNRAGARKNLCLSCRSDMRMLLNSLAVSKVLTFCLRTPFKFFAMTQLKIEIRNVENMYNWNTRQLLINNLKIYREEIRYEQIRVLNIFYSHSGDLADRRRSADRRLKTADLVRKIDVTLVQW